MWLTPGLEIRSPAMPWHRTFPVVLSSLVLLAASAGLAQRGPAGRAAADRKPLDPDVFAVQLLLGVTDQTPQPWNGRVEVDRGEVVGVEGARFRKDDRLAGRNGWEARSLLIRKASAKAAAKKAVFAAKA